MLICLALVISTIGVYYQIRGHVPVSYDDEYIIYNQYVKAGTVWESLAWAFRLSGEERTYWKPLAWLSHMLDFQFYGNDFGMHYMTSMLLHILNSLMLFLLLRKMTGELWMSAFVSGLFALHPLNVESVAWLTQRQNVLCTFFFLLTLWAYINYSKRVNIFRYSIVLAAYTLGLMTKPVLVAVPIILIVLDYWPLERIVSRAEETKCDLKTYLLPFSRSVAEKIPLFILAAISIILSFQRMGSHSVDSLITTSETATLIMRIKSVFLSYAGYIVKMIWPQNLSILYPLPGSLPGWWAAAAALFLLTVSALAIYCYRIKPYFIVGWAWYIIFLVPVVCIIQAGFQPVIGDRYAYVSLIGLFVVISWGMGDLLRHMRCSTQGISILVSTILIICFVISWFQVHYWENSFRLFKNAVRVVPGSYLAHNNLALAMVQAGMTDEAEKHYKISLEIKPDYFKAHNNLANLLVSQGMNDEAIFHYKKALIQRPDDWILYNNLGLALMKAGMEKDAVTFLKRALEINQDPRTHYNLGETLIRIGRYKEAIAQFKKVIALKPDFPNALNRMTYARTKEGQNKGTNNR